MQSPSLLWSSKPTVCLLCSHYDHLAWQSTLFPLSTAQLKRISVFSVCATLGLTPITVFTRDTDQRRIAFRASSRERDGKTCVWEWLYGFIPAGKKTKGSFQHTLWQVTTGVRCPKQSERWVIGAENAAKEKGEGGRIGVFVCLSDLPAWRGSKSRSRKPCQRTGAAVCCYGNWSAACYGDTGSMSLTTRNDSMTPQVKITLSCRGKEGAIKELVVKQEIKLLSCMVTNDAVSPSRYSRLRYATVNLHFSSKQSHLGCIAAKKPGFVLAVVIKLK